MLTIRAMSDGIGYAANHLEHRDYYAEGERVVGQWQGHGAKLLGLGGDVRSEDFEAVREGRDPRTDQFLRQRKSADRISSDGTMQSRARNLYDFTISAPKSVSIMAMIGGDQRLIEAHQGAVAEALQQLESHAAVRVRKNGANEDRTTGNLVLAVYQHDTSRELDPQLHTHAVAANLSYDGTEGCWKALQASGIYERTAYLTEVYRNALARNVRALGYEIHNRRDAKGRDTGFEIRGISEDLAAKYSQRSRQRDKAVQQFIRQNGREPTANEIAVLIRESRAEKLTDISTVEVRKRQRDHLTSVENSEIEQLKTSCHARAIELEPAQRSLAYAKDHTFERVSVGCDHDLLAEALRYGRGRIDHDELKGRLILEESSGAILRDGNEVATAESLQREREMIQRINEGIGAFPRIGGTRTFVPSNTLRPDQKRAVQFVLDSHDGAINVCGAAGTGKTATLRELHRALRETDREVLAIAPTMSAVEELQNVGFRNPLTVERLLQDERVHGSLHGKILIVDEAGMISGRQMWELLHLAGSHSARVVFCGDTKQIQSVEACDALRVLERESQLKSVRLTNVERQKVSAYREAVQELRRDPSSGFGKLEEMGAIREVGWHSRAQVVAAAYADSESKGQKALVVCPTHDEIDRVTDAIRANRKGAGILRDAVQLTRDVSLTWTTAQKSNMRNYHAGQLLGFHKNVRGIRKHETVEVVTVEENRIIVRKESGEVYALTKKQAKAFDVLDRRAIEVAVGDKLLLTANRRDSSLRTINGEIVTVSGVDDNGRLHLEDGRVLPSNFKQFTHGYAVTAHRSQGKSVDAVIVSADGMRKELFYVAASRGREQISIITSDKERLRETIAHSSARKSASELARQRRPGPRERIHQTILATRPVETEVIRPLQPSRNKTKVERSYDRGISR
jgi:conjugative relaxase-like TrwC/TraI family protein